MGFSLHNLIVWAALCSIVKAYPEVPVNGTSPWTVVEPGWVPEPSIRGTIGIIWTCVVTIFACSWTVTHPNFPDRGASYYYSYSVLEKWFFKSKINMCLAALLAPELLAAAAVIDWLDAKAWTKTITDMKKEQFKYSQTFFVIMGGVHLHFADCTKVLGEDDNGEFDSDRAMDHFGRALSFDLFTIDSISVMEVEGRAKTNHILKAIVCFQASWLVIQVIGRALGKLPITTLEVVTVGYVACALITYAAWWHKPQNPEVHIKLNFKTMTGAEFYQRLSVMKEMSPSHLSLWFIIPLLTIPAVFGAVHCIAWNFYFASYAESVIWKVASILTAVLPLPLFVASMKKPLRIWGLVTAIPYAVVRLYLIVEPFVAFRRVPQGIFYTVNWAKWIPHI